MTTAYGDLDVLGTFVTFVNLTSPIKVFPLFLLSAISLEKLNCYDYFRIDFFFICLFLFFRSLFRHPSAWEGKSWVSTCRCLASKNSDPAIIRICALTVIPKERNVRQFWKNTTFRVGVPLNPWVNYPIFRFAFYFIFLKEIIRIGNDWSTREKFKKKKKAEKNEMPSVNAKTSLILCHLLCFYLYIKLSWKMIIT